jgi:hypothetical protein
VDRCHNRVFEHLRHCPSPKAMPDIGCLVGENSQLAWGFLQAGQLEFGILLCKFACIRFQRVRIAGPKLFKYGAAAHGVVNDHEPPRLTETDGRREARHFNKAFQCACGQGLGPKAPNVTTPDEKVTQLGTESVVEAHDRRITSCRSHHYLSDF